MRASRCKIFRLLGSSSFATRASSRASVYRSAEIRAAARLDRYVDDCGSASMADQPPPFSRQHRDL